MQDTDLQGTYKNLFEGKSQSVVQCKNIDFESTRDDVFSTLQLSVMNNKTIEESIMEYVQVEELEGDNQYDTEMHGKQDAKKFVRFKEFPPVLQVSLNRYQFDPERGSMAKNNQEFHFGDILHLDQILPKQSNQSYDNQMNRMSQMEMSQKNGSS